MELQKQGCKLRALRLLCGIPVENKIIIFFHNSEKHEICDTFKFELLTPLNIR